MRVEWISIQISVKDIVDIVRRSVGNTKWKLRQDRQRSMKTLMSIMILGHTGGHWFVDGVQWSLSGGVQ